MVRKKKMTMKSPIFVLFMIFKFIFLNNLNLCHSLLYDMSIVSACFSVLSDFISPLNFPFIARNPEDVFIERAREREYSYSVIIHNI